MKSPWLLQSILILIIAPISAIGAMYLFEGGETDNYPELMDDYKSLILAYGDFDNRISMLEEVANNQSAKVSEFVDDQNQLRDDLTSLNMGLSTQIEQVRQSVESIEDHLTAPPVIKEEPKKEEKKKWSDYTEGVDFILFTSPICQVCPTHKQFAKQLAAEGFKVRIIDESDSGGTEVRKLFGVTGFPSYVGVKDGQVVLDENGKPKISYGSIQIAPNQWMVSRSEIFKLLE